MLDLSLPDLEDEIGQEIRRNKSISGKELKAHLGIEQWICVRQEHIQITNLSLPRRHRSRDLSRDDQK